MLNSVFGEPDLVQGGFAGCEAQHQQTAFAKRKWQDAMFRVNTATLRCSGSPTSCAPIQARSASEGNGYAWPVG